MMTLDEQAALSALTIPGTHDTCARYGGDLAECQTLSVTDQLNIGIRALDIRCRHYKDQFPIHHEIIYQHIDFGQVQQECIAFLQANPSETIVMHIKKEYDDADNKKTFEQVFDGYLADTQQFWYLGNAIPALGKVRGKIVLLRRFDLDNPQTVKGINANPWVDNASFTIDNLGVQLDIQDQYNVPTIFNIGHKWDLVRAFLTTAAAAQPSILFINFTSGASGGAYPNAIAKGFAGCDGINKWLLADMTPLPVERYGIVYLNFPEYPNAELVPAIYDKNLFVARRVREDALVSK
jgi:1-phosphatidylinositol phosphodiesterase